MRFRDQFQIGASFLMLVAGLLLAWRGLETGGVPICLMSAAFLAFAAYRFYWIARFWNGRKM